MTDEERVTGVARLMAEGLQLSCDHPQCSCDHECERLDKAIEWARPTAERIVESLSPQGMPIDAAPRNGSDVLLLFARRRPAIGWHDGANWLSSDSDDRLPDPIKWIPLAAFEEATKT